MADQARSEMREPYRPPLLNELSERVRYALIANTLTQAMLARRLEVSEKHVSRVLNGHDDGSLPFWDAMLRESGYPRTEGEKGNLPAGTGCRCSHGFSCHVCQGCDDHHEPGCSRQQPSANGDAQGVDDSPSSPAVVAQSAPQTEPSSRGTGVLRPGGDGRNAPTVRPPLGSQDGAS